TFTVRLAAQPAPDADQVSTADDATGGADAASVNANKLGIAVEPLSPDEAARDPKLERAVAGSGGALIVTDISPDGPAFRKLSAAQGNPDLIVQINGKPARTRADFRAALDGVRTGDIVTLLVLRRTPDGWDTGIVRIRAR
ncbi:MAG TPA: PDZ domain-containing protein, partial [Gemmatimonadales bacterium]|nr:PDZ domain-containing protein [Gemmatimonadales bacterium]